MTTKKGKIRKFRTKVVQKIQHQVHCYKCPNNHLFITALLSLVFFLLLELTLRIYDLYRDAPLVDVPSHLFGGAAMAMGIYWVLSLTIVEKKKIATIVFTIIGAIIWEILETLQELLFYNPPYLMDFFFWDGFWDVIITTTGGLLALWFLGILRKMYNLPEEKNNG